MARLVPRSGRLMGLELKDWAVTWPLIGLWIADFQSKVSSLYSRVRKTLLVRAANESKRGAVKLAFQGGHSNLFGWSLCFCHC